MQVFRTINKDRIMINADVNTNNYLTKDYVIKDLFWILVIVNTSVINQVTKENMYTMKIVTAEKN